MEKKYSLSEFGYKAVFGKFAGQANGSVWLQQGGTVVLAVVVSEACDEFPGFLPLTVEYREQFAAAGKIPGGYLKREGRPSDLEILTGRLVDRSLRPLFPDKYFDKVLVSITVYSVDRQHPPQPLALLAAGLALTSSNIPFLGPVGVCEIARIKGNWIFNPTYDQVQESETKIIVAGNADGVNMVEGTANEISEEEFVDVLFKAHEKIKKQVLWQAEIQKDLDVKKAPIVETLDWDLWTERAKEVLTQERVKKIFTADKSERSAARDELQALFLGTYAQQIEELGVSKTFLVYVFEKVLKEVVTELIFKLGKRIDSRDFEQIRHISTEVGLLPFNHGSALFTRGKTQALASVTLGGGQDQMRVDSLMGEMNKPFMLHYNFPSFSVGEARPSRGPGRREIGHGYLAYSAIEQVLPSQEKFPYTIRIVSDILESDGSSSMATVCVSTMGLMDAGVPIKSMVSGIAMGLLMDDKGDFKVLTDILGIEDAFGLMDFKVAGTADGITAIQMDIKYRGGLARPLFEQALAQARRGRLYILDKMKEVMSKPKETLSALVPQIVSFMIPREKIGAVIGSGGKTIREIIEKTGTTIDIEDSGLVKVFGQPGPDLDRAVKWVNLLSGSIDVGTKYPGIVKRAADFGFFVELAPGVDGLVHISTVPRKDQEAFMKKYKDGDAVVVEVLDYDKTTSRIRLKIVG